MVPTTSASTSAGPTTGSGDSLPIGPIGGAIGGGAVAIIVVVAIVAIVLVLRSATITLVSVSVVRNVSAQIKEEGSAPIRRHDTYYDQPCPFQADQRADRCECEG